MKLLRVLIEDDRLFTDPFDVVTVGNAQLPGLLVRSVRRAPAAVLLQLHPIAVVMPVLLGYVVASLALPAFERHMHASVTSHGSPSGGCRERKKYSYWLSGA